VLPWIEALEYLSEVGPARIAAHNRRLVDALRRIVSDAGHEPLTGPGLESPPFLVFEPSGGRDAASLVDRLADQGVHVSLREGRVRVSPHVHNAPEDVERFRRALLR
jgi:selenocysteine lyase/cysteine desulfurase